MAMYIANNFLKKTAAVTLRAKIDHHQSKANQLTFTHSKHLSVPPDLVRLSRPPPKKKEKNYNNNNKNYNNTTEKKNRPKGKVFYPVCLMIGLRNRSKWSFRSKRFIFRDPAPFLKRCDLALT